MKFTPPIYRRVVASGRIVEVWQQFYNHRITVAEPQSDGYSFEGAWCYAGADQKERALAAARAWDGEGDPVGWNKNVMTGEWRATPDVVGLTLTP